jgi:peptide chain release factor 1
MNLIQRLDRIAARADELRAMLSEVMGGEAYVKASRELSELEPVVARIDDLRAAEEARREAEAMMADPEMKELAEAELYDLKDRIPALEHELRIALLP